MNDNQLAFIINVVTMMIIFPLWLGSIILVVGTEFHPVYVMVCVGLTTCVYKLHEAIKELQDSDD